jgi:hypothetical protein
MSFAIYVTITYENWKQNIDDNCVLKSMEWMFSIHNVIRQVLSESFLSLTKSKLLLKKKIVLLFGYNK